MARGHTYDKWKELGYQVKRGEQHSFIHFGNKCFTRDQVVRIDDIEEEDDDDEEDTYEEFESEHEDRDDYYSDSEDYGHTPYHHWNPEDG